ncbi:sensor histidine kinase [Streptosporangiaceae bacterium NEAU-GS5]|nr:sensor histidine kinase [Streptosporangiaceae bacterium NEAU-GS5]
MLPLSGDGPLSHIAVPYGSAGGYLRSVLPVITRRLARGGRVLLVAPRRNLDLIRRELGDDFRRLDSGVSEEWYGHPARTLAAFVEYAEARQPVLMIGEPIWADERHEREWSKIEAVANVALARFECTALCAYDRRETRPHVLADVLRTHPDSIVDGVAWPCDHYEPPETIEWDDPPLPHPPADASRVGFDPGDPGPMRRFVASQAKAAGLARHRVASLVMAATELAVIAAGQGTVAMWSEERELACEVTHPGAEFDKRFAGYLPDGDRGLWICRQLCDFADIRADRSQLRMRLR